ncbi:hypothetical protein GNN02_20625 [Salmonella enterica]|uniref:hypothetical protein n=1 Tax=Salmonella enterica TaxID=28901 RepID=UPI000B549093|nr:hypothetical protein [Salmonella enterica]ECU8746533.1 hypothetical protein [Salmonella enterica subsp. diarizonae str. CFSAN000558]HAE8381254.1 hypothetical protein [Salmonella enterica subsp. diarizonae serovar 50:k:z]ASG75579.1 hypothetical protein LFZ53_10485 [Salmonella enterica subsp. diarizonae serovar 50:k:z str. MZ0080]EAS1441543.1 hypothetical protein [Salmonella enterica]EAY3614126.1 hypothetical protein [Salmonella enterica]
MINPNKSLTQKALASVQFLRMHAQAMADDDDFFIAIMSDPHAVAATAIEQLVKENAELRAQLVAFQKAANPAVAVDPAKEDSEHTCYTSFTKGACVRLKWHPYQRGIVRDNRLDDRRGYLIFVCFESEFEENRWVKARNLELVPDK